MPSKRNFLKKVFGRGRELNPSHATDDTKGPSTTASSTNDQLNAEIPSVQPSQFQTIEASRSSMVTINGNVFEGTKSRCQPNTGCHQERETKMCMSFPVPSTFANVTLNDFLRKYLQLTGTKVTCREGGCGACIVSAEIPDPGKPRQYLHRSINSVREMLVHIDK